MSSSTKDIYQIMMGDMCIDVAYKNIKHMYLRVYPPFGRMRISAPLRMDMDTIGEFVRSKREWINKQQANLRNQAKEDQREYINQEIHCYLGKRYLLEIIPHNAPPKVVLNQGTIALYVRENASSNKRKAVLDDWYRRRLKEIVPDYIVKWEKAMKVKVQTFGIKKMKTRWGTCNPEAGRIWLNLELAKNSLRCLEYIIVHEMVHLLERTHNKIFRAYMDKFLPRWRSYKAELDSRPLAH